MRGAIVPHAPLLLPELESEEVAGAAGVVRDAIGTIDAMGAEVIVIVSPHAGATGVYRDVAGDLSAFGVGGIGIEAATDVKLVEAAAEAGGIQLLGSPVDHGVVVPLRLGGWNQPVVALGMEEGIGDQRDSIAHVARAVRRIAEQAQILLVASANLSAGLSERAPLTRLDHAAKAEELVTLMVGTDIGWLEDNAPVVCRTMASCGAGPLSVVGRLLRGRRTEILAHEAPVGVGYLVARTA